MVAAIIKGPVMSWQLIQGVPWPSPIDFTGFSPSNPMTPATLTEKVEENEKMIDKNVHAMIILLVLID